MNLPTMKTFSIFQSKLTFLGIAPSNLTTVIWLVSLAVFGSVSRGDVQWSDLAKQRVLVVGDSITYGGQYVAFMEAYLKLKFPDNKLDILNLGLPSETVSGLSEEGHAGGRFPRPDLHERLDRTLEQIKPDIVLACYGMNCGIYFPYGVDRFEAYKVGIRRLRDRVQASGATMIHVTPPVFDPIPITKRTLPAGLLSYKGPYEGYDEVLNLYAAWLIAMRGEGWKVIDIHGPMKQLLRVHRTHDPSFLFAGDGVHMNDEAHWLTAQWIMKSLGAPDLFSEWTAPEIMATATLGEETAFVSLIKQRQRLMCDTWLTEIGHLRPGMAKGLPLDQAVEKAADLDTQIQALVKLIGINF